MKASIALLAASIAHHAHSALNTEALAKQYFGNDAPWYLNRIPFLEISDSTLQDVYYYRWSIFRAHQRDLGANGYISDEFLNDVSWQNEPWASLNDATGFHLLEGRWCRDRRFKEDYATFMYSSNSQTRQYSESMAAGVWGGYLVDGVAEDAYKRLDEMETVYEAWFDAYDSSRSLYYVEPLRDATEYTISSIDATNGSDGFTGGNSFRPSINSYQYANALAIANAAALKGGLQDTVDTYTSKAASIKRNVQASLWNSTFQHFIDRFQVNNTYVTYWDFIRGRELVGYVPWAHDLPDDTPTYAQAWKHVLNSSQLLGSHGLRTVEPSYEYYMVQYRYDAATGLPECQWNGPAWPYQETQVLTGLANFLDHYDNGSTSGVITKADYMMLFRQYANMHYNPSRGGILDLEEDYYPDTGAPIVGLPRSPHYFHSGFVDLVLTGLVGIRPSADDVLEVNPLIDSSVTYFRVDNVLYHGHNVSVQFDATGSQYGTSGLQVEVDGAVVASSDSLSRLSVNVTRLSPPPSLNSKIARSIQLNSSYAYPSGSVSAGNNTAAATQQALDGRIMFYSLPLEAGARNGWDSPVGNGSSIWFQIDFGTNTSVSSADVAFYGNTTQGYDAPSGFSVQVPGSDGSWTDVVSDGTAVANGVASVEWEERSVSKIRLLFTPKDGYMVRLVEFKVY